MPNLNLTRIMSPLSPAGPVRPGSTPSARAPTLLPTHPASILDAQEDMAAMLASVMRRQMSRRVDRPVRLSQGDRASDMTHTQKAGVSKIQMMLQSGGMSFGESYAQARGLFPDPEELALLLAGLRDDQEIEASVRAEIEEALAELMREHGHARISMGLNTRHVVGDFSRLMRVSARDLRRAYRALAGATTDESITYRYLIDTFGFARRGLALDFLEQALAADIAADTPTHPPEAFQPLLALLFQLRLLRSADAVLLSSAGHQRRRRKPTQGDEEPDLFDQAMIELLIFSLSNIKDAVKQFTHCVQRWLTFAGANGVSEWTGRVLRAMAEIPTELYPDLVYRHTLLTGLSEVADDLFRSRRGSSARLRGIHG